MSKHTKGPWEIKGPTIPMMSATILARSPRTPEYKTTIAHIEQQNDLDTGDEQDQGNAALIAAAPEMLEALKATQQSLCEHCPQYMDAMAEQVGDHTDECLAAMDLIARIEGEKS